MAEHKFHNKHHLVLDYTAQPEPFRAPVGGSSGEGVPRQNREAHGQSLLRQINELEPVFAQAHEQQVMAGLEEGFGLHIEFESFPNIELAFESLAAERSGIELLNVRDDSENKKILAAVFVPDGKLHILENKITAYLDKAKDNSKGSPKNQKLLDAIQSIHVASINSLWTDDLDAFPKSPKEAFWWEVWLPIRSDRSAVIEQFTKLAEGLEFRVAKGYIEFPERTILLVYGSLEQMQRSVLTLNSIAELRRAKETADFFDSLPPDDQGDWADELLQRVTVPPAGGIVPHVCLLDTGINDAHPLLTPAITPTDTHTVDPGWGKNDVVGHGTEMAGLALLGNLTSALASAGPIPVFHRLESVKLLNQNHSNGGNPANHGYLTIQAVSHPEITAPTRKRVFSMAVTARDARDRGRPSAWSATVDRLAVDYDNQGETPRLFVLSAGNVDDPNAWTNYPYSNTTDGIHDPGQAWNALTVGANTELIHITEPDTDDYRPIAPIGGLSPFSTTSQTWAQHWPLKPDVVFEGGNAAITSLYGTPYAETKASLSLLSTCAELTKRLFTTTNATSAASALTARMVARLMAEYPNLRLETIRGLIVHSADWTPAMRKQFLTNPTSPSKSDVVNLTRHCGFGQPDLSRALWSVENSLTLICEADLKPFIREGSKEPKLRDMNLHRLPWPLAELEELGEMEVEMRVTLSYFIEPNPSARGIKSRYRYESHGLRFDVKRPHESETEFRERINLVARDGEESSGTSSSNDLNWMLGTRNRHRGSLHSDIWKGPAADLASRGMLAVFPVSGWWKTRPKLERYNQRANYSLLISIRAPEIDVELYNAIESQIKVAVKV